MAQTTPAGETSRPRGKLQIHRIFEDVTEMEICEKCKDLCLSCFTIEGFPNSKLCQPCGIYSMKYPTNYISQDVYSEPCYYRVGMCILRAFLFVTLVIVPYQLGVHPNFIDAIKYAFARGYLLPGLFVHILFCESPLERIRTLMESFFFRMENMFGFLAIGCFLTDADYLADTMSVTLQQQAKQLSESQDEVAKLTNELEDLKEEITGFKRQLKSFAEYSLMGVIEVTEEEMANWALPDAITTVDELVDDHEHLNELDVLDERLFGFNDEYYSLMETTSTSDYYSEDNDEDDPSELLEWDVN